MENNCTTYLREITYWNSCIPSASTTNGSWLVDKSTNIFWGFDMSSVICERRNKKKYVIITRSAAGVSRHLQWNKSATVNTAATNAVSLLWWRANAQNVSQHTLYGVQHIHINLTLIHCAFYHHADTDQVLTGTSILGITLTFLSRSQLTTYN